MPGTPVQTDPGIYYKTAADAIATTDQTADAILGLAGRRTYTPLRHTFVE